MPFGSIKRQRRRKRTDEDGDPEFQVAPMIDVLLVLTLFFMSITSTELLKKDKNLQLPDAKNAKKESAKHQPGKITINVTWDYNKNTAGFNIDGRNYPDAKSLGGYLTPQVQADPRSYVLIRADRDVQYSNISDVMAACASSGISTVSFAVIIGGAKNKNASQPDAAAAP
jgi:biopolymer transport protein ExbD